MEKIRRATLNDLDAIIQLCELEGWSQTTKKEMYTKAFPNSLVLVYEIDNQVVGFARAISDGFYTTYLCELIVNQNFRHRHIGKKLIDEIFNIYPNARMELISGNDAFYEKLNFSYKAKAYRRYKNQES